MRSRREFGLIGDLTTGWLGAVIGGWLFRRLGFVAPNDAAGHVVVALLGATILLIGIRVLRRVTFVTSGAAPTDTAGPLVDLEEHIRRLGHLERRILSGFLTRQPTARDEPESAER